MADNGCVKYEDLIWLAGFLEGEGSFCITRSTTPPRKFPHSDRKYRDYVNYVLHVCSTDEDVIARAAKILGAKYIKNPTKTKGQKDFFRCHISGPYAISWMIQLRSHMGNRRRAQIDTCIKEWAKRGCVVKWESFNKFYPDVSEEFKAYLKYPPMMGGGDNVQLDKNTTTGAIIAADAVVVGTTTQYHQRVKISIGTSGSAADVHSGNRLPVITTTGSLIAVRATGTSLAVKVSGSITIVEPITISGAVKVSGVVTVSPTGNFYVITPTGTSLPVRVSGNVNLAEPITISGVVRATGTRADRGAFTKGTSLIFPIGGYFGTGGVTASGQLSAIRTSSQGITFIRATGTALPVKVSGSVTIVEPVTISGVVRVSGNVNIAEPITISGSITSIINTVVTKVSGTVTIAEPVTISGVVKVSGNVNIAEPITISGSITSITNTVVVKTSGTVTIAEPITISGSITSITNAVSVTGGPVKVVGAAANDAAVAGNPVLIANRARLTISGISVTTGDVVYG